MEVIMLFVIDMQNDFIHKERGLMPVNDADSIVSGIVSKIREYEEEGDLIFYTLNFHGDLYEDQRSEEEKIWGHDLYGQLKEALSPHQQITKDYYAVKPTVFESIMRQYENQSQYTERIEFVGVETHVCVLSNAVVLRNLIPEARIIIDASLCRSGSMELHEKALDVMEGLDMKVVNRR